MGYTNSSLVTYRKISPNRNSPRNHTIDTITIHCMAGNLSIESCGNLFLRSSTKASSNYGIGSDGRIALYVEEKDRSWASSSRSNDNRAVTIEVANDGGASTGWHVSDKAMKSLINLCADICKRNNIKELKWKADKSLIGQIDKQNMTVHRWFANKSCPGDYLYNKHYYIAEQVNKKLGGSSSSNTSTPSTSTSKYTYQKFLSDLKTIFKLPSNALSLGIFAKTITVSARKNRRHAVVKPIQKYLNSLGYNCGIADGIAGVKFTSAVKKFQKAHGCVQDGEITARNATWRALLKIK